MKRIQEYKEEILTFCVFILIFLLFSSTKTLSQPIINLNPILEFNLTGFLYDSLKFVVLTLPYLISCLLIILTIVYFANLIKSPTLRKNLKIGSILILVIGTFVLAASILEPASFQAKKIDNTTTTTTSQDTKSNKSFQTYQSTSFPLVSLDLELLKNLIILTLIVLIIFVSTIILRASRLNNIALKEKDDLYSNLKPINNANKNKEYVIMEYLLVSKELEMKGINPDFSLTPIEFESETVRNLRINEIAKVTYYYEVARFSNDEISDEMLADFKNHIKEIRRKLAMTKSSELN